MHEAYFSKSERSNHAWPKRVRRASDTSTLCNDAGNVVGGGDGGIHRKEDSCNAKWKFAAEMKLWCEHARCLLCFAFVAYRHTGKGPHSSQHSTSNSHCMQWRRSTNNHIGSLLAYLAYFILYILYILDLYAFKNVCHACREMKGMCHLFGKRGGKSKYNVETHTHTQHTQHTPHPTHHRIFYSILIM